ncbi:MAG: hypothetical protein ACYCX9_06550 [Candidatus Dormibacteria bacterium]|jgi:hypothetical protein
MNAERVEASLLAHGRELPVLRQRSVEKVLPRATKVVLAGFRTDAFGNRSARRDLPKPKRAGLDHDRKVWGGRGAAITKEQWRALRDATRWWFAASPESDKYFDHGRCR